MNSMLHVLPSGSVGGAPNNVIRLIEEVRELIPDCAHEVLVPADNTAYLRRLDDLKIKKEVLPRAASVFTSAFSFFLQLMKKKTQRGSTLVITHGRGCGFIHRPLAQILGFRTMHFYRGYTPTYTVRSGLLRFLLNCIDRVLCLRGQVVAVGKDEFDSIQRKLQPAHLVLVRNLVREVAWDARSGSVKFEYVSIGRRSYQKGFDRFLQVADMLPQKKFLWVGADEDIDLSNLDIPNNVELIDYLPTEKIFSLATAVLCLSRWEGCSTVVSECIVSGKPFVSLDCPGVSEFKINGKNDQIFYNDIASLVKGISEINPNDLSRYAVITREHFEIEMDANLNARKFLIAIK